MKYATIPSYLREDFFSAVAQGPRDARQLDRNIVAGANMDGPDEDGHYNLGSIDAAYMVHVARLAGQNGYRVSEEMAVYNGRHGHDILDANILGGTLVCAYLYFNPKDKASFRAGQEGTHMYCWQSQRAFEPFNWHAMLERTQPRMIVNIREHGAESNTELPTEMLHHGAYEWVNRATPYTARHPQKRYLIQSYDVLVNRAA